MHLANTLKDYSLAHLSDDKPLEKPVGVVLHSCFASGCSYPYSIPEIINTFEKHRVSCHFLISRCGRIYNLVEMNRVAWHAGVSYLKDLQISNLNNHSVGIELVATDSSGYTPQQLSSLLGLIRDLSRQLGIEFITSHAYIAPERKTDPWQFDWKLFKKNLKPERLGLKVFV